MNKLPKEKSFPLKKTHQAKQSTIDSLSGFIRFSLLDLKSIIYELVLPFQRELVLLTNRKNDNEFSNLLLFDHYTLIPSIQRPIYNTFENLTLRWKKMIDSLKEIQLFIEGFQVTYQREQLDFGSEKECLSILSEIFPTRLFDYSIKTNQSPKIFSEIWRFFRDSQSPRTLKIDLMGLKFQLYDRLKLFLFGISLPSMNLEDFHIHQAVFEGNLPLIRRLCLRETSQVFFCDIEEQDPLGMTALQLAVKLSNRDAALVLTECGANPKFRGNPLIKTALEDSVYMKSKSIVKILVLANHRLKQNKWESEKCNLSNALQNVPNFSCEMSWECDSKLIPFARKITPSDKYRIFKRDNELRVDMTLAGFSKLKCIRGAMSVMFTGKKRFVLVDHEKNKITDLFDDLKNDQIEDMVEEIMKSENNHNELKTENVMFRPTLNWKGDIMKETIGNIETIKYSAKGSLNFLVKKKEYLANLNCKEFKSFADYFQFCLEENLMKEFNIKADSKELCKNIDKYVQNNEDYKQFSNEDDISKKSQQNKIIKKSINSTLWIANKFPLQIQHLLPILEILSSVSHNIAQFKDFLTHNFLKEGSLFPIKAIIPLFYTLNAIISFNNFKFESPEQNIFQIQDEQESITELRIKTEGNYSQKSKIEPISDWRTFYKRFISNFEIKPNRSPPKNQESKKSIIKLNENLSFYKEANENESEASLEQIQKKFCGLDNDLINVFDDSNNSSITNIKALDIPSEKKMNNIKIFNTHSHEINRLGKHRPNLNINIPIIPEKTMVNKVRESKIFHNIGQINESTKNRRHPEKKFVFNEFESQSTSHANSYLEKNGAKIKKKFIFDEMKIKDNQKQERILSLEISKGNKKANEEIYSKILGKKKTQDVDVIYFKK